MASMRCNNSSILASDVKCQTWLTFSGVFSALILSFLHLKPHLLAKTERGSARSITMANTPKHQPDPAALTSGCWTAMSIAAMVHLTRLYDACTVADACGLTSVNRVPQSCERGQQREGC